MEDLRVKDDRGGEAVAASSSTSAPARSWASLAWLATARRARRGASRASARPASGTITLAGNDITDASPRKIERRWASATSRRPSPLRARAVASRSPTTSSSTSYHAGAVRARGIRATTRPSEAAQRRASRSSTCAHRRPTVSAGDAVRRQPAEGRRRARVRPRSRAARARPTDARPRRRQHRVHPQAGHRQARRRDGRAARLGGAGRGARAVRPHRGDVPRRVWSPSVDGRTADKTSRPADGDRRARAGTTAGARRGRGMATRGIGRRPAEALAAPTRRPPGRVATTWALISVPLTAVILGLVVGGFMHHREHVGRDAGLRGGPCPSSPMRRCSRAGSAAVRASPARSSRPPRCS